MAQPVTNHEVNNQNGLKYGIFNIPDIGNIIPASLMIQDLDDLRPIGCSYMNNWGRERPGTSPEEILK